MNATCGAKCYEQYKKLNPNGSLRKMSLVSQILMADWYSTRCALTWKMKGTKFNRLLLVLQVKTHHIEGNGVGLLPTPNSSPQEVTEESTMKRKEIYGGKTRAMYLEHFAAMGMLPTPTASDCGEKLTGLENQDSITKRLRQVNGSISQLNPRFVGEMMGFPQNWTELPFQNGAKNH